MPPVPTNGNRDADLMLELANYIDAGIAGVTLGVNFFVNELPEPGLANLPDITDALYMIEMPGPLGQDEDMYLDTETAKFDMWASSSSSTTAKTLLRQVYDILERKGNYALVNWYVYFSYADGTIRPESRGREGNRLYSQSWTIKCRNLNNIS